MAYIDTSPIDPAVLLESVAGSECGAQIVFLGTVREGPEDGPVVSIDYSAYTEMAEEEFDRILDEARARWPGARIAARHRTGEIPIGAASIGVAVAMPHRADAYRVSRFVIDEAKQRLPIWKKERFTDGSAQWREEAADPSSGKP